MKRFFVTLAGCCITLSLALAADPPGPAVPLDGVTLDAAKLRVHFIDIGAGLAMLVETPGDRKHVFVDGGNTGLEELEAYVGHFVPQNQPVDLAIVTHADQDHYLGMGRILSKYSVKEFWYTGYTSQKLTKKKKNGKPSNWSSFLSQVKKEKGCVRKLKIGTTFDPGDTHTLDDRDTMTTSDDVTIRLLNVDHAPPKVDPASKRKFNEAKRRNNASLVFALEFKDVSFLITGDINGRDDAHEDPEHDEEIDSEEAELVGRHGQNPSCRLTATVLQIPHHGSNGSSSLPFLRAVNPAWVVIPAGHEFDHPRPEALRRIKSAGILDTRVLRTDDGDSTPEDSVTKDSESDDSFVFETDGHTITRILRILVELND